MDLSPGYRELAPPPAAGAAVACRWTRHTGVQGEAARVIPDGCADLVWREGVGTQVAGPDTGPQVVTYPPGTVLVGVRFRPGAGGAALGVPLHHLRDQRVDLADLQPGLARRLHGRLSPTEALERLGQAAATLVAAAPPDPIARTVADRLAGPRIDLGRLAGEVALSPRQLRRRCHDAIGYGPKTLHRVLRLQAWLDRLAAGRGDDLAGSAAETGFADQAHLTRECVQLTGLTPAAQVRRLRAVGLAGVDP